MLPESGYVPQTHKELYMMAESRLLLKMDCQTDESGVLRWKSSGTPVKPSLIEEAGYTLPEKQVESYKAYIDRRVAQMTQVR